MTLGISLINGVEEMAVAGLISHRPSRAGPLLAASALLPALSPTPQHGPLTVPEVTSLLK